MSNQRYLSATNTHLPVATGTVVGFIRDPKRFRLMEYVQLVETPSTTGTYQYLDPDHPARVVTKAGFAWAPGAKAPQGHTNLGDFQINDFTLERLGYTFALGEEAVEQAREFAKWDPIEYEAKAMAQQAMTVRTMDVWSPGGTLNLDNPANWPATNTSTAAQLAGVANTNNWANATSQNKLIQQSLFQAARQINLLTNGAVEPSDLVLVISPTAAIAIAASPEIIDFVKQQASSPEILKNGWDNPNQLWGLPSTLYGFKLIVESTPFVNTYPVVGGSAQTAGNRLYAKADNTACLLARPGGIDAPFGSRSFCTAQCYWYKYDMAVESIHWPWDKMHEGRVVDYRTFITPAIISGYLITHILS